MDSAASVFALQLEVQQLTDKVNLLAGGADGVELAEAILSRDAEIREKDGLLMDAVQVRGLLSGVALSASGCCCGCRLASVPLWFCRYVDAGAVLSSSPAFTRRPMSE